LKILVVVCLFLMACWIPLPGNAADIESWLCRINDNTPFKTDKITVVKTNARLVVPEGNETGGRITRGRGVIEKHFSFQADYDAGKKEFVRIRPDTTPMEGERQLRKDLVGALKLLLRDRCSSVEIYAGTPDGKKDLRISGKMTFKVEVAYERESQMPVFYQRSSAFTVSDGKQASLSKKQILRIFEQRYRKFIPLPADAELDKAWMVDFPLTPDELLPVAEVWYRPRKHNRKDYVLVQFNPESQELTIYEKKWSASKRRGKGHSTDESQGMGGSG
jgi:hypothetical protein